MRAAGPTPEEAPVTISETLAEFVTGTGYDDLPPLAIKHAKVIIASTLASAAMGRDIGSTAIFRDLAKERGGTPEAALWFDGGPNVPVMDAARVNAIMSDAAASDDTDLAGSGHLGTVTSTAALTMAERCGASTRDVLAAIVLGYDVANRLGRRTNYGQLGFHAGVNTIFGATVAAAKVMGLAPKETAHALSLAATSIDMGWPTLTSSGETARRTLPCPCAPRMTASARPSRVSGTATD